MTSTTTWRSAEANLQHFAGCRLGLFIHFGLYSLLGRGEWALNKEQIPVDEYRKLADRFTAPQFDADAIVRAAKDAGCRYVCFTTMHHEGFALYDSQVNPFNSMRHAAKRDFVAETVDACRRHGLRVHLYHSLNHWTAEPDGVAALEDAAARKAFVDFAHERLRELVTRFNPIDCLWYDGWWPFDAEGWRAEAMNAMVRAIQPHILFNGRNGLPGDFATPEQHVSAPNPWCPWEACITHNRNWGYHAGDHHFKPTADIVQMVTQVATGAGNLLLNVGPDGEGVVPEPSRRMLRELGEWMQTAGEAIYDSEPFGFSLREPDAQRGDWMHQGGFTTRGHTLYAHLPNWPGSTFAIGGLQVQAKSARLLQSNTPVRLDQQGTRLVLHDLPANPAHPLGDVLAIECDAPPRLYLCGGLRPPTVPHPRYDPVPSDLPG